MKTTSNFKLSKSTKRVLATLPTEMRSNFKRMMIDAEVSFARAKLAKLSRNKNEEKVS
jgi:hypothetical protein